MSELSYVTVSTRNKQKRYRIGNINTLPTKENPNIDCYNGTQMDGQDKSYTLDTTGYKYLVVNATNLEDIQVEIGTEATAYEPYTGGIPSPNPDYPQEIRSVVNPVVKIHGKNLLPFPYADKSKVANGVTFDVMNDGRVHVFGTATGNAYINLSEGIEWSDESFSSSTSNGIKLIGNLFYNKDNKILSHCVNTGNTVDYVLSPMVLLENETNRSYEQYKEQVVNLPYTLNAIPVKNGGNIIIDGQQYIADYVDVERGKVVRKIDKIILTGKENWTMGFESWTTYPHVFKTDGLKENILEGNVINTKYTWYQKYANKDLNSMNAPYNKCIAISDARFSSVNEFTNELKKQDSNGTPLIAYYITSIPQEENLSLEEIEFLKSLSTYYSVTNVTVDSEQLDGYTVFNYPISMQNGWNYVKQQLNDNRDYIYDIDTKTQGIDTQAAEAYVNSEYAVALTELEV